MAYLPVSAVRRLCPLEHPAGIGYGAAGSPPCNQSVNQTNQLVKSINLIQQSTGSIKCPLEHPAGIGCGAAGSPPCNQPISQSINSLVKIGSIKYLS
jgi:hypothetical protein